MPFGPPPNMSKLIRNFTEHIREFSGRPNQVDLSVRIVETMRTARTQPEIHDLSLAGEIRFHDCIRPYESFANVKTRVPETCFHESRPVGVRVNLLASSKKA